MAICRRKLSTVIVYLCVFTISGVVGRNHTLMLTDEVREKFPVSTFGFYSGGTLHINMTLSFNTEDLKNPNLTTFGFTLDKTVSNGAMSAYFEDKDKYCALRKKGKDILGSDQAVSIVLMKINLTSKTLTLKRYGDDIQTLKVVALPLVKQVAPPVVQNSSSGETGVQTNSTKVKRSADGHIPALTNTIKIKVERKRNTEGVSKTTIEAGFSVHIRNESEEGLYNLYFHNCANNGSKTDIKISLKMDIREKNPTSYLSAGEMPMPTMYFVLCVLFFLTGCFWLYILRTSTDGVYKMHYLMLVLVYVKSLSFLFHGVNYHFIGMFGIHEAAWAVLYYITHLMKGSLLFLTIVLIGTGWTLIKHMLTERDKKIFLVVIPLQILANVAQIIIDETEEGDSLYTTFKIVLFLVDLLCCGAILFPVIWSIRHLQEASQTDGKAAINLQKLKLFRQFYILIVCYIYFTRIIVYLVQMVMTYMYNPWLSELFKELSTYVLFIVTGSKFRPASNNPYLQVPTEEDEEDIEMDEVLTKSGVYDNLVKVNQGNSLDKPSGAIKQRESSHEYD